MDHHFSFVVNHGKKNAHIQGICCLVLWWWGVVACGREGRRGGGDDGRGDDGSGGGGERGSTTKYGLIFSFGDGETSSAVSERDLAQVRSFLNTATVTFCSPRRLNHNLTISVSCFAIVLRGRLDPSLRSPLHVGSPSNLSIWFCTALSLN